MSSSPTSSSSEGVHASFANLVDLPCPVEAILGHGTVTVGACLRLARHSVIRLNESAGEDLQLVVNGVPVMRGEVVIVEDGGAIRITEILPAPGEER